MFRAQRFEPESQIRARNKISLFANWGKKLLIAGICTTVILTGCATARNYGNLNNKTKKEEKDLKIVSAETKISGTLYRYETRDDWNYINVYKNNEFFKRIEFKTIYHYWGGKYEAFSASNINFEKNFKNRKLFADGYFVLMIGVLYKDFYYSYLIDIRTGDIKGLVLEPKKYLERYNLSYKVIPPSKSKSKAWEICVVDKSGEVLRSTHFTNDGKVSLIDEGFGSPKRKSK